MQILYALRIRIARQTNHDGNFEKKNIVIHFPFIFPSLLSLHLVGTVLRLCFLYFLRLQRAIYISYAVCMSTCGTHGTIGFLNFRFALFRKRIHNYFKLLLIKSINQFLYNITFAKLAMEQKQTQSQG